MCGSALHLTFHDVVNSNTWFQLELPIEYIVYRTVSRNYDTTAIALSFRRQAVWAELRWPLSLRETLSGIRCVREKSMKLRVTCRNSWQFGPGYPSPAHWYALHYRPFRVVIAAQASYSLVSAQHARKTSELQEAGVSTVFVCWQHPG